MHPAGQIPALEGGVDCFGAEAFGLPFFVCSEDDQVCGGAFGDALIGQVVEGGGVLAHFAHQFHKGQAARFDQFCDAKGQRGLQADDAAGGFGQRLSLFVDAVGRVVGGNHVDGSVLQALDNSLPVCFRPKGRIHFRQGAIGQDSFIRQGKMMGRRLGGHMGAPSLRGAYCFYGSCRTDVLDVYV